MGWSGGARLGGGAACMRSIDCILLQLLIFILQLSQTTIQTLGIACVELMVSGSYSPRVNNVDLILLKVKFIFQYYLMQMANKIMLILLFFA